jgi:hypothetical protein
MHEGGGKSAPQQYTVKAQESRGRKSGGWDREEKNKRGEEGQRHSFSKIKAWLCAGSPQDVVPVHAPVRWPVIGENARRAGNARKDFVQQDCEPVSAVVIVHGVYAFTLVRHLPDGGQDQVGLSGVERAARADIACPGGTPDGKVAQGIDGGFTNDDIQVVILGAAAPQAFLAAGRKAREIPVLDLVTADSVPVDVGKHGIAAHIDADTAGEAEIGEDRGRNKPLLKQIGMGAVDRAHRHIARADLDQVAGNRFEVRKISLRIGAGEGRGELEQPRPEFAADGPEMPALALLHEVDDGAVVGVFSYGEINPVPVPIDGDDDLVPVRVHHDGAVPGGGFAVKAIAASSGVFG